MRILYVEDNPANLFLVQRVARMGNHEVLNYTSGETALENFERDNPDLVLMDVQLAGNMTGLDVVRKLRGSGYRLPIIAVTAYAMIGDRERCLEAGCDDYLAKPLPVPKLVELIRRYDPLQQDGTPVATSVTQPSRPTTEMDVLIALVKPPDLQKPVVDGKTPTTEAPVVDGKAATTEAPVAKPATTETPTAETKPSVADVAETKPSVPEAPPSVAEVKPVVPEAPAAEVKPEAPAPPTEHKPADAKPAEPPAPETSVSSASNAAPTPDAVKPEEPEADPDAKTEPFRPQNMQVKKEDTV